jgi:hypothetical protein
MAVGPMMRSHWKVVKAGARAARAALTVPPRAGYTDDWQLPTGGSGTEVPVLGNVCSTLAPSLKRMPIMRSSNSSRACRSLVLLAAFALAAVGLAATKAAAVTQLIRVPASAPGLDELGLALDHVIHDGTDVLVPVSEEDRDALKRAAIPYVTVIADMESYYANRLEAERPLWENAPDGAGFGFGSMGGYYTFDEVVAKLDEMRATYPTLITAKEPIGVSQQNRTIWMVKISDNADQNEDEPEMLYTGLTHAREPEGMELLLYYMYYLLEHYGTDPEATYLVNTRELYFVPVVNPDGYVRNQTTNPTGGGMWRKNRRNNGDGSFGVDLNRNYSYNWGANNQGSSPNPSSDTYRGLSAFSEPETQAIRQFHQGKHIFNSFHYHTFGNYEIHPFGLSPTTLPPEPDRTLYLLYGGEITAMNGYLLGNSWATVAYGVNGDAVDWSYGEQVEKNKVFALTPEVGGDSDGFWPASSRIIPLAQENLGPNLYYAWITGARAVYVGTTAGPDVPAGQTGTAVVEITNYGLGANADDVTLTLASNDPYVTIPQPVNSFPSVPPLGIGDNSANPLLFQVAAAAPNGHVIPFDLTVKQGPVVRAQANFQVTVSATTGVPATQAPAITRLALLAHPNPMGPTTELVAGLPATASAELAIVDIAGRVRRTLWTTSEATAGEHRIAFDGKDADGQRLPSGVYLARLRSGGSQTQARLVILR